MPPTYTDAEKALLTPEELAGLNDDTFVDEGHDQVVDPELAATAALDETGQAAPAPAPDPAATPAPAPAPEPAPAPAPVAEAAPVPAPAPAPQPAPAPAPAPARDFDAEINGLRTQQLEIATKHDDGDLTTAEYERQRAAIDDRIADAREARADVRRTARDTAADWFTDHVGPFLEAHPEFKAGGLNVALDYEVRALQDAALADGKNQFDPSILEAAYAKLGGKPAAAQPAPRPDLPGREIPPAIGGLPNAGNNDDLTDGGRWAAMDRLADTDPAAHEAAMARMTPADRDAYLRN